MHQSNTQQSSVSADSSCVKNLGPTVCVLLWFLTNELIAEFDPLLKKAVRWGYSCELKCLSDLSHEADARLFRKMANNKEHCIHQLLPPAKILPIKLCHSRRLFALPHCCHFNLYKRSFALQNLSDNAS